MIRELYGLAVIVSMAAVCLVFFGLVSDGLAWVLAHRWRQRAHVRSVLEESRRQSLDTAARIPHAKALRDAERRRVEREVGIRIAEDGHITILRH